MLFLQSQRCFLLPRPLLTPVIWIVNGTLASGKLITGSFTYNADTNICSSVNGRSIGGVGPFTALALATTSATGPILVSVDHPLPPPQICPDYLTRDANLEPELTPATTDWDPMVRIVARGLAFSTNNAGQVITALRLGLLPNSGLGAVILFLFRVP